MHISAFILWCGYAASREAFRADPTLTFPALQGALDLGHAYRSLTGDWGVFLDA